MQDFSKINLDNTINSGQVFLWQKEEKYWFGVNGQNILKINEFGKIKSYSNQKPDYLRNQDNLEIILKSISKDKIINSAITKYLGLRILRQDPFQCLISFIISSNSNIQKIKICLEKICKTFGEKIFFENKEFYLFPEPKTLAFASINEIKKCGVGYRAKFISEASKMVYYKKINFEYLKNCEYSEAKELMSQIPGVGNKVADCILLFSLDKLEAFPLDRWMIRILEKYYPQLFELSTKTITQRQYQKLHEKIIKYFGTNAGYAQQFLFKMERENYKKNWL